MRTLDAFGKCILASGIAAALLALPGTAYARGYSVLYSFSSQNHSAAGAGPTGLIRDGAGNLYGTTSEGGGVINRGVVFKVAADGTETVLYTFCNCADGAYPFGGVIKDSAGNLYGTTSAGGTGCPICGGGGTVFKLAPDGTETVLYNFCSENNCSDGIDPTSRLIRDTSGNLYGTTGYGGTYNKGVVFKLAPDGTETVLYAFTGGSDGAEPIAGVIEDQSGNLYGTTYSGGAFGGGVVFKVSPDGTETALYGFCSQRNCSDGAYPYAGVIEDQSGNLYGTAEFGGGGLNCDGETCGVIFEIAANGTYTVLHQFSGVDGGIPIGGLIKDTAGNLYGTTFDGGYFGDGVVFKLAPDGTERVLHSFAGGSDGKWPEAGLINDKAGNLYGTTVACDPPRSGCGGTVFRLRK
jgi:uncharacterized repeat protein (TIGR03803 family)